MRHAIRKLLVGAIVPIALSIGWTGSAQADRFDDIAASPMSGGRPTAEAAKSLKDEMQFQRATQVYLWALPLINTLGMKYGSEQTFGAGYNVLPIWKDRLSAKTLVTTPNSDVLYAMSYADLGDTGPLVLDMPPGMQGILLDFWQRPIPGPQLGPSKVFAGDVGFFGPDGGKGGKFLILPPGYNGAVPAGYFVFHSGTKNVFIFLRAFYEDPSNLAPAVELLEKARFYPLGQENTAKPMQFPNASGVAVDMLPRSDSSAFDQLKWLIDHEPNSIADESFRGMLASIGIERGKPFAPDAAMRRMLDRAAETGYKMSRAIGFESKVGDIDFRVYPDRQWLNPFTSGYPVNLSWTRIPAGYRAIDNRTWFFTNYYSISPGMVSATPGVGANYLIGFTDATGAPLQGDKAYTLNLPANIPAANFWSLTLYDAANGSGLDNGEPFPSLGSRDKPQQEQDGSTVLYLGPRAPEGKASNWLRTVPGKDFFVILRLYGPLQAAIDHTWKPGDLEPAASRIMQAPTDRQAGAPQVPIPQAAIQVPGPAPGTAMTKAYVQNVARMAYVWGWPLVNMANRIAGVAKVTEPGLLGGALPVAYNRLAMLTGYIAPNQRFVTCPNQDVVYATGWFNLNKEPMVFQVPDFGDRFWVYALYDGRTDEFSKIGKQYGTKPGFYLMVGPNWTGNPPAGITAVLRSSTSGVLAAPRIFMEDTPEDHAAIQPVLSQVNFYPLSQFDGKLKTTDWSKLPHIPAPPSSGKGETQWVNPGTFFDELPAVMKQVPPLPGEEGLYSWINSVLDAAAKDPEIRQTLKETAAATEREVITPLFQWRYNGRSAGNGWTSPINGAEWGTDYLNRTGTAKTNMYDNRPEETKYIYTDDDSAGRQLNGQNTYAVTFATGQVPPVKGFWSLTLYNEEHFFHPNALGRYSLGTKNKTLKYNADGSLTLYAGAKSPGADKESNWLPAPSDHFSLYLRAYWADRAIIDGTWTPPAIERVEGGSRALQ